jgi:hypothetical protein
VSQFETGDVSQFETGDVSQFETLDQFETPPSLRISGARNVTSQKVLAGLAFLP